MSNYPYSQDLSGKMIGGTNAFGLPVASDTQLFPLGCELYDDEGRGTLYRYVRATASPISAGNVVSYDGGPLTVSQTAASANGVALRAGVAPYAFAASQYGFIAVSGFVTGVAASGTINPGDILVPDVASAGHVIALAPAGAYAQADAVAALNRIGIAGGTASGGVVIVMLQGLL